jgi:predicted dithiol-disulfide oxidoreductase (DUF899 family)
MRLPCYHTYSSYARGIDLMNTTYNFLDLTAKGPDENPDATQDWVRCGCPSGCTFMERSAIRISICGL